jgi:hypothetical protein
LNGFQVKNEFGQPILAGGNGDDNFLVKFFFFFFDQVDEVFQIMAEFGNPR